MSEIIAATQAGTLESNDVMITVFPSPKGSGISVDLKSIVLAQYGPAIRKVIMDTVVSQGVKDVSIKANDRGALDCTIRARILVALERAGITLSNVYGKTLREKEI